MATALLASLAADNLLPLLDSFDEPMAAFTPGGRLLAANAAYRDAAVEPLTAGDWGATCADVLTGNAWSGPDPLRRRGRARLSPLRDSRGQVYAVLYRAEVEAAASEASLWRQSERFDCLSDTVPNALYVCEEHRCIFVNRWWLEYTGMSEEQALGDGWIGTLHPDDLPAAFAAWQRAEAEARPMEIQQRIRGADGGYRWFLNRAVPLRRDGGRITHWYGTCTDIDEQKRAEQALAEGERRLPELAADLRRSNADLDEYAGLISHDLQAPLRLISSFSQLLERRCGDQLGKEGRTWLKEVRQGATRMQAMIRGLLDYSRATQTESSAARPVAADEALAAALQNLRDPIAERAAIIAAEPLPAVLGNAGCLIHVFQNLIENAIKYCPAGRRPEIAVGCRRQGEHWEFAVRDNGNGIPAALRERIFEPFRRGEDSRPGNGIGLAITRKLIERYGGQVWIEPRQEGQGACFRFTLPAAESAPPT